MDQSDTTIIFTTSSETAIIQGLHIYTHTLTNLWIMALDEPIHWVLASAGATAGASPPPATEIVGVSTMGASVLAMTAT